jgi:hypothetical protein
MSQERRDRQKEKLGTRNPNWTGQRIATYALAIACACGLGYFLYHRSQHQHDAFARCLSERGVKMYGAYWCPHCADQKEKFDASFAYVPYVECGIKGDPRGVAQACKDANIKHYPTWQFPPTGDRVERVFTLEELSDRTGCSLP